MSITSTWPGVVYFTRGTPWHLQSGDALRTFDRVWYTRSLQNAGVGEKALIRPMFPGPRDYYSKPKTIPQSSLLDWPFSEALSSVKIVRHERWYYFRALSTTGKETYLLKSKSFDTIQGSVRRISNYNITKEMMDIMNNTIFLAYDKDKTPDQLAMQSMAGELSLLADAIAEVSQKLLEQGGYGLMTASKLWDAVGSINDARDLLLIPPLASDFES